MSSQRRTRFMYDLSASAGSAADCRREITRVIAPSPWLCFKLSRISAKPIKNPGKAPVVFRFQPHSLSRACHTLQWSLPSAVSSATTGSIAGHKYCDARPPRVLVTLECIGRVECRASKWKLSASFKNLNEERVLYKHCCLEQVFMLWEIITQRNSTCREWHVSTIELALISKCSLAFQCYLAITG